jgi:CspA family cold shock protein
VKFYDSAKGFGFVASDEGGDVYLPKSALPDGVEAVQPGERLELSVVDGRRGLQALTARVIEPAPTVAGARRSPDELHGLVEDMVKVLEDSVQRDLRRGRYPDKVKARKVAVLVHAVARELEGV